MPTGSAPRSSIRTCRTMCCGWRRLVPAAGIPGTPEPLPARIVEDGANDVTIEAGLPAEGFVVLRDSFDPSWRATVDGLPAEIGRANGLYRAVRVLAGHHVIRFRYRPRALGVGLTISGMAALALLTVCLRSRRTRAGAAASKDSRSSS